MNLLKPGLKDKMIKDQNGIKRGIAEIRIQIENQNNTITNTISNLEAERNGKLKTEYERWSKGLR